MSEKQGFSLPRRVSIPTLQDTRPAWNKCLSTNYAQLQRDHEARVSRAIASTPGFKEWRKKRGQ